MGLRVTVLLCALLCGCASVPPAATEPPTVLFKDASFDAPGERYRADDLFALSEPMRQFLQKDIARQLRTEGPVNGLIDALYRTGQLKLSYDPSQTRNASQAFEARAGNCLSLVIMTAAFAKELGVDVQFNAANIEEVWSRTEGLLVGSGHVNVTLSSRPSDLATRVYQVPMTVDFLSADEIGNLPIHQVPERTVVAMYMNNRAVEALVGGGIDDAYGWARAAIRADPAFGKSYNTLGIIYLEHRDPDQAARVLAYELQRRPDDTTVMSNLADALSSMGRQSEADALRQRLARLDPNPPYHFFDLGKEAMQRGDFESARRFFAREVDRADYNDEFHYWLGVACFRLGDIDGARKQLELALERTRAGRTHDLYAAKLAWLQSNERAAPDRPAPGARRH